jgi:hypothetical protein
VSSTFLAVITAPRPGVGYVRQTCRQINATLTTPHSGVLKNLFSDGPIGPDWRELGGPGWNVYDEPDQAPRGPRWNIWRVFRAIEDYDRLLLFEDDISIAAAGVDRMLAVDVPEDLAFVTFYDGRALAEGTPAGLYRHNVAMVEGPGFWGSLAMLFPRRTVRYLAERSYDVDGELPPHWRRHTRPRGSADLVMAWLLNRSPWPEYGIHVPSLVDHAGDVSTPLEGGRGGRRGRNVAR